MGLSPFAFVQTNAMLALLSKCKFSAKDITLCGVGTRVFADGEDTHPLRLTSELVDLRAGYANPPLRLWHNDCVLSELCSQTKAPLG